jgi:hypothetical protein
MSGWSFVRRLKKEVLFISRAPLLASLLPTVDELVLEGSHFQLARCLLPIGKERTIATRIPVVPVFVSN